jgi:hypothetical protein
MAQRPRRRRRAAAVAAALSTAGTAAMACGFHDDVTLARGVMNWVYPDSLHVVGAVGTAVAERRLRPPDVRTGPDPFGARYHRTVATLQRFGEALGSPSPTLSLVLLEPMLWTRFVAVDGHLRAQVHVSGPAPGDVVLVSDEIVVRAIVEGSLAITDAHREGLVRTYGSDEQRARFLASYGRTAEVNRTKGGSP